MEAERAAREAREKKEASLLVSEAASSLSAFLCTGGICFFRKFGSKIRVDGQGEVLLLFGAAIATAFCVVKMHQHLKLRAFSTLYRSVLIVVALLAILAVAADFACLS